MRTRDASFVVLLAGTCVATEALGQEGRAAPVAVPARNVCLDAIPASTLRRVPVYLTARLVDSSGSHSTLRDGVDLLTQSVAKTTLALLGAGDGVLPAAEPTVTWRSLESEVLVVARRDGRISWKVKPPTRPSVVHVDDKGAEIVGRALDSVQARGETLVFPATVTVDSISWLLQLKRAGLDEAGEPRVPKLRMGFLVFSVLSPRERQVSVERVRVRYPPDLRNSGFTGRILMQFVVDTTGHAVPSTIRDLFPAGTPPLSTDEQVAYEQFLRYTRQALELGWFKPASLGGCPVPQLVQQPFSFVLQDGQPTP